jgi:hypothetical protein
MDRPSRLTQKDGTTNRQADDGSYQRGQGLGVQDTGILQPLPSRPLSVSIGVYERGQFCMAAPAVNTLFRRTQARRVGEY